jgi:hypothetical protein
MPAGQSDICRESLKPRPDSAVLSGSVINSQLKCTVARIAVSLALLAVPVGAVGCGAGTRLVRNVVAHKVANHFAKTPGERRAVNIAFCVASVHQALHDFAYHHRVYGAATASIAIKDCERGFSKYAP